MEEKAKDTLKAALQKLPKYQASANSWEMLNEALDQEGKVSDLRETHTETLQQALETLPIYPAPKGAWKHIEAKLGRRWKRSVATWSIAAVIIILIGAAFALKIGLEASEKPAVGPIAERHLPSKPLTTAEIAEYETQMAAEEEALKKCLDKLDKQSNPELETTLQKLESLTQTRDSLGLLLSEGKSLPGTSPRLNRLEKRRAHLIKELHSQLCQENPQD